MEWEQTRLRHMSAAWASSTRAIATDTTIGRSKDLLHTSTDSSISPTCVQSSSASDGSGSTWQDSPTEEHVLWYRLSLNPPLTSWRGSDGESFQQKSQECIKSQSPQLARESLFGWVAFILSLIIIHARWYAVTLVLDGRYPSCGWATYRSTACLCVYIRSSSMSSMTHPFPIRLAMIPLNVPGSGRPWWYECGWCWGRCLSTARDVSTRYPAVETVATYSSAHSFSRRIWSSSSGVKSFWILKVFLISSGDLPLIMLATVLQPTSRSCLISK